MDCVSEMHQAALFHEGTVRLLALLPVARADAASGRGHCLPDGAEAARAIAAGRRLALIVRPQETAWMVELVSHTASAGPAIRVAMEVASDTDPEVAARSLLAGVLAFGAPSGTPTCFVLQGVTLPLSPQALNAVRATSIADDVAQARERLDALLAADFPAGYATASFAKLAPERRRLMMTAVHQAALLGIAEHPPKQIPRDLPTNR